jgi:phosphoribosylformylglycinamidine synthase I
MVIVPGGFSYGDYLRAGALARFSPVMKAVERFAASGGLVLGICNGFQILVEAGLLPGALMRNRSLKFICKEVFLRVENPRLPYTGLYQKGQVIRLPIAHADGNYYVDPGTLSEMKRRDQIVFRYCSPEGEVSEEHNPNGSAEAIAGVCNASGNVLGMMPHPERRAEAVLGGDDGLILFKSVLNFASREPVHGKS